MPATSPTEVIPLCSGASEYHTALSFVHEHVVAHIRRSDKRSQLSSLCGEARLYDADNIRLEKFKILPAETRSFPGLLQGRSFETFLHHGWNRFVADDPAGLLERPPFARVQLAVSAGVYQNRV
ncbi:unnamed protein product [Amoebophrya sp. A120]|nr:unnamed protein product [Amoebophrya sp. A120]|eukprot:GSA120T00006542001.1